LPLEKIGQEFGIEKYSSVSNIATRAEKQLAQNKQLHKRIDEIDLKVNKGQAKTCPFYVLPLRLSAARD